MTPRGGLQFGAPLPIQVAERFPNHGSYDDLLEGTRVGVVWYGTPELGSWFIHSTSILAHPLSFPVLKLRPDELRLITDTESVAEIVAGARVLGAEISPDAVGWYVTVAGEFDK